MRHASLPENTSVAWAEGATGGHVEQLVANLTLAILCCQMSAADMAHAYLARAFAQSIARHARTARSARIKLARIRATAAGFAEILLLPIIGGAASVPSVDLHSLVNRHRDKFHRLPAVELGDVEIAYFTARIRTARVTASIAALDGVEDTEKLEASTSAILKDCLQREIRPTDPFDAADDYFALARGFVILDQAPLAALCLRKAQIALESYAASSSRIESHLAVIEGMKKKFVQISKDLQATAA